MPLKTLGKNSALDRIDEEIEYSLVRTKANPSAKQFAPVFVQLGTELTEVWKLELGLFKARYAADAFLEQADEELDPLVDKLASTILIEVGNDRAAPLYRRFFGSQRPSDVKKPRLGKQLDTVRSWIPSLEQSEIDALKQIGEEMKEAVKLADEAVANRASADQKLADFRTIGERAKFINDLNAKRASVYGSLRQIAHEKPQLPANWADRFFLHDSRPQPATTTDVEARIEMLQTQLRQQTKLLEELRGQEQAAAQKETEAVAAQKQAERDALLRQAEELARRAEQLRLELEQPVPER